jgi:hypothetical protein
MPTLDALDYERFSLEETTPLSLDEAMEKANELRASDGHRDNFYRIEYADASQLSFKVTTIPASSVYAEFTTRVAQVLARYLTRSARIR